MNTDRLASMIVAFLETMELKGYATTTMASYKSTLVRALRDGVDLEDTAMTDVWADLATKPATRSYRRSVFRTWHNWRTNRASTALESGRVSNAALADLLTPVRGRIDGTPPQRQTSVLVLRAFLATVDDPWDAKETVGWLTDRPGVEDAFRAGYAALQVVAEETYPDIPRLPDIAESEIPMGVQAAVAYVAKALDHDFTVAAALTWAQVNRNVDAEWLLEDVLDPHYTPRSTWLAHTPPMHRALRHLWQWSTKVLHRQPEDTDPLFITPAGTRMTRGQIRSYRATPVHLIPALAETQAKPVEAPKPKIDLGDGSDPFA